MPARKRTVEIEVIADDRKARDSLNSLDNNVSKTGKTLSNFAKIAAGAFAFDRVIDFGRAAVDAFSDLNESSNAVNVTFGEAADGILELGENAARSVGLANAEFNQLAVGFAAFADTIAEGAGSDVTSVVENLTTRIADFASVMNLDVPEAAEKFRSGLAGETEPLRQFGIDVSAAAVTQKILAEGIAASTSEITEQDKILGRYLLIMEKTEKTAGDFANTSDQLANRQRILAAEFKDAQAQLGEGLVPAMEALLEIGTKAIPVIGNVALEVAEFTGAMSEAEAQAQRFRNLAGVQVIRTMEDLDSILNTIQFDLETVHEQFRFGRVTSLNYYEALRNLIEGGQLTSDELEFLQENLSIVAERFDLNTATVQRLDAVIEKELTPDLTTLEGKLAAIEGQTGVLRVQFEKAIGGTLAFGEAAETASGGVDFLNGSLRTLQNRINEIDFLKLIEIEKSGGLGGGRPFGTLAEDRERQERRAS